MLLIISHEVAGFEDLFDYIYILHQGRMIEQRTREELQNKYLHPVFPGIEGIYFEVTGQVLGGKIT